MDKTKLTPMMKQYFEIKEQYQDAIVLYRLGDFYEMFFDDALKASKILEIALTGRNAGLEEKIPMCGVPQHTLDSYVKKLIDNGFKVAICEQLQPESNSKLVKRDVIKVITPGTNTQIESSEYNYLVSLDEDYAFYYLAFCDLSTGKLKAFRLNRNKQELYNMLIQYNVKEIVVDYNFNTSLFNDLIKRYPLIISFAKIEKETLIENESFTKVFNLLFNYIDKMQKNTFLHYLPIEFQDNDYLYIDFASKFNLEITSNIKSNDKKGTLYGFLDKTKTAMGSRLLKEYLEFPLIDKTLIEKRLDFLDCLIENYFTSEKLLKLLNEIYDLARLASKVSQENIMHKEILWLKTSLIKIKEIKSILDEVDNDIFNEYSLKLIELDEIIQIIDEAINDDLINNTDILIKDGFNEELDQYRFYLKNSSQWIIDFEQQQRQLTGIKNLKVKYNKVFGYFIEISNGNKHLIKDEYNYVRKQTLVNAERYINTELKEQEVLIEKANENIVKLENSLYQEIKRKLSKYTKDIQKVSQEIAYLDVMLSFYQIVNDYGYSRPVFNDNHILEIEDAFHPIIKNLDYDQEFINNDLFMDSNTNILLITGPNMGGKSTYMRQLALIIIMAQIGCYVPAKKANLMIFEQLFTRIGASDDLLQGQSTFMVEMLEASNAVNNLSENSLILFDELGRGTATYDGMAIAWSIIEYLSASKKGKTLFSTHYHELIALEKENIQNYYASVSENDSQITFTYKIKPGSIDKSYGIHVAKLANLPESIINRANQLLKEFEKDKIKVSEVEYVNVNPYEDIIKQLQEIDINNLSPLDALMLLDSIKKKVS